MLGEDRVLAGETRSTQLRHLWSQQNASWNQHGVHPLPRKIKSVKRCWSQSSCSLFLLDFVGGFVFSKVNLDSAWWTNRELRATQRRLSGAAKPPWSKRKAFSSEIVEYWGWVYEEGCADQLTHWRCQARARKCWSRDSELRACGSSEVYPAENTHSQRGSPKKQGSRH